MTAIYLTLFGLIGLFAHWLKKWARGQVDVGFKAYMIEHKKHSIATLVCLFSAIAGMYLLGDVPLNGQTMATAFLAGFGIDSAINKAPGQN